VKRLDKPQENPTNHIAAAATVAEARTMASVVGALRRNWQIRNPPEATKNDKPLRFGILGAADIG
jgi:hypothetical protein